MKSSSQDICGEDFFCYYISFCNDLLYLLYPHMGIIWGYNSK